MTEQKFTINQQDDEMTGYYYNMLMSSLHVSVSKHLMDEYFTVIWANDCFYESTLYTKEEYEAAYSNHCSEYFKQFPEEYEKFAKAIEAAIAENRPGYEAICKMPQKGGSYIWIKITGTFTEEQVDGIPVIYSVFTDVTEAVEQKELQEQLKTALKMAEAANREKTDFLSRMSHDIRTPMNAIIGMADIASSHLNNPDKMKDCLKKIMLSSQHLLGLINDVLDMSKIESGKMTLSSNEMSLPETMENIVAIMQPGIKEKAQKFDVRLISIKHEYFYCDSLRLRQVLINILSNASKFTPKGGRVLLEVEELPSDTPDIAQFQFTVEDTGIGIGPEFIDHIFDTFSREQDSRVDTTEGSGLGMAISKKIVDLMSGTIKVSSRRGVGTTFVVNLPLHICSSQDKNFHFQNLKVIVVDDDNVVCEHTSKMLGELGVTADWESSGKKAMEKIIQAEEDNAPYNAVILDWQMPELSGMELVQMIRRQFSKDLPVLIISSYDWSDIEEEAEKAGVTGFIMKPLFMSTLCSGLQRYVLGQSNYEDEHSRRADFSGKRFLLVEDNELNREVAVEILITAGAQMEYACDGAQGVEKFKQSPINYYDCILMDVQMPVMNGYEATQRIRAMKRDDAGTVPILAMTADAFAEDVAEAKRAGMNGHLAKPLDTTVLFREISKYIHV